MHRARTSSLVRVTATASGLLAATLVLAACGGPGVAVHGVVAPTSGAPVALADVSTTASGTLAALLRAPAGVVWHGVAASPSLRVATVGAGAISLLWMDPAQLRFRFVPGRVTPENGPASRADSRPSTWVPRMVAAFDGGYKLTDHVGGYYYLARTVSPLRAGYASLVGYRDGSLTVGSWGRDVQMSSRVVVVRQNLRPLIDRGVSQVRRTDTNHTWGLALRGLARANRSALGVLPNGSLVFEYGSSVRPAQMAATLVRLGVTEAIMLDMNAKWPTGFLYTHTGGQVHGWKINAHIVRAPSLYYSRWKKDFIAVEQR